MAQVTARHSGERGFALVGVLLIAAALSMLGVFAMRTSMTDVRLSSNKHRSTQAFFAAEAGVSRMVSALVANEEAFDGRPTAKDLGLATSKPSAPNLGSRQAYWFPQVTYDTSSPPAYVDVVSRGAVLGTNSQADVEVRIVYNPGAAVTTDPRWTNGIFGDEYVEMSGGYMDAYNSCDGPYNIATRSMDAPVGTNSTLAGTVKLSGDATIYGNVTVGPGGNPSTVISAWGPGAITGTKTAATAKETHPLATDPGGGILTVLTFPGDVQTLTAGTYRFAKLVIPGGKTLIIDGEVVAISNGEFTTSGSGKVILKPNAKFTVYALGKVTISGSAVDNQTQVPANMIINSLGSASVTISGSGTLHGAVYAPQSLVTISGSAQLFGAFVSKQIKLSGGAMVHFDKCLATGGTGTTEEESASDRPFYVQSWRSQ